ncbi:hypothetical protein QO172_11660 [Pseudomonas aeruginosa]|uniref:hypothetical protein n=1 Tax=Pseudomonas aeruginosa TaxID=287 RepID=UPI000F53CCE8|nr:hypothetical protein [Pseudomonas aeruginosa]MDV6691910.1 hypothetical protein [Pseudomonas aeruginosa]MEE2453342.1 hypothetical protein [Pseudomonas aeruginosa]MEE3568246.1 hypothetical protein [Pseudomonas aeruginosa]HCF1684343.1 hypothetical protein [Pseudomonas aeruginosa]HEP7936193.1 hypothetical protein [Pseudomonas aeruginosa]
MADRAVTAAHGAITAAGRAGTFAFGTVSSGTEDTDTFAGGAATSTENTGMVNQSAPLVRLTFALAT